MATPTFLDIFFPYKKKANPYAGMQPGEVPFDYSGDPTELVNQPYEQPPVWRQALQPYTAGRVADINQEYSLKPFAAEQEENLAATYEPKRHARALQFALDTNDAIEGQKHKFATTGVAMMRKAGLLPQQFVEIDDATLAKMWGSNINQQNMLSEANARSDVTNNVAGAQSLARLANANLSAGHSKYELGALPKRYQLENKQLDTAINQQPMLARAGDVELSNRLGRATAEGHTLAVEDLLGTPYTRGFANDASTRLGLRQTEDEHSLLPLRTELTKGRLESSLGALPYTTLAEKLGAQGDVYRATHGVDFAQIPSLRYIPTMTDKGVVYQRSPFPSQIEQAMEDNTAALAQLGQQSELGRVGISKALPTIPIDSALPQITRPAVTSPIIKPTSINTEEQPAVKPAAANFPGKTTKNYKGQTVQTPSEADKKAVQDGINKLSTYASKAGKTTLQVLEEIIALLNARQSPSTGKE